MLVFGDKTNDVSVAVGNSLIKESIEEKLLGVTIDKDLSFKNHLVLSVRRPVRNFMH